MAYCPIIPLPNSLSRPRIHSGHSMSLGLSSNLLAVIRNLSRRTSMALGFSAIIEPNTNNTIAMAIQVPIVSP